MALPDGRESRSTREMQLQTTRGGRWEVGSSEVRAG